MSTTPAPTPPADRSTGTSPDPAPGRHAAPPEPRGAGPSESRTGGPTGTPTTPRPARTLPWWGFGLANVVVILVVAVVVWWLLIDPKWSVFGSYPQPFNALLFWTIIASVWVAFNCGWIGPARLRQPARGLVGILVPIAISIVITLLLAYGWGHFDPTFAASRAKGAGFGAGRMEQPWVGLAEIGALVLPTLAVYAVLALPNLATWADPKTALISTSTLTGWFYSCIVAVVITGLIWDNNPWALLGTPARTALGSLVGNIVLGTGIFFAATALARVLMGPANAAALGSGITSYAAEFGVCWVFWLVAWPNVFGNRPVHLGAAANAAVRTVVTLVLGIATFLLYQFVVAGSVLHEPAAGVSMHGDALGFMDLCVLVTIFYVLFLESVGLPRPEPDAEAADAETIAVETGHHPAV